MDHYVRKERKSWEENINNASKLFIYLVVTVHHVFVDVAQDGAVVVYGPEMQMVPGSIPPGAIYFFFVYLFLDLFFFRVIFL